MAEKPGAFLRELAVPFNCTAAAVHCALEKLNITRKKSFTYYEKSELKRAGYRVRIRRVRRSKRVYADESGVHTWLPREYARASRGKPAEALMRGKRFDRINIIGAPRDGKPIAVERYRHTADGAFFEWRFEKRLLRELPKG